MSGGKTMMQCTIKFIELSPFIPEYRACKMLKMKMFEERLAIYIRNQLVGQPICTYQELCERAAEVIGSRSIVKISGLS